MFSAGWMMQGLPVALHEAKRIKSQILTLSPDWKMACRRAWRIQTLHLKRIQPSSIIIVETKNSKSDDAMHIEAMKDAALFPTLSNHLPNLIGVTKISRVHPPLHQGFRPCIP